MKTERPYMLKLQETMQPMRDMLSYYETRIKIIDESLKDTKRTPWEQNEDKILRLKTIQEMDVLKKILFQKNQYFENYSRQFELDLTAAKKNFKEVVRKAWIKAEKNEVLMNLMKRANFKEADTNDEVLVIMYNKLKEYV
jgi:hypothetical protein